MICPRCNVFCFCPTDVRQSISNTFFSCPLRLSNILVRIMVNSYLSDILVRQIFKRCPTQAVRHKLSDTSCPTQAVQHVCPTCTRAVQHIWQMSNTAYVCPTQAVWRVSNMFPHLSNTFVRHFVRHIYKLSSSVVQHNCPTDVQHRLSDTIVQHICPTRLSSTTCPTRPVQHNVNLSNTTCPTRPVQHNVDLSNSTCPTRLSNTTLTCPTRLSDTTCPVRHKLSNTFVRHNLSDTTCPTQTVQHVCPTQPVRHILSDTSCTTHSVRHNLSDTNCPTHFCENVQFNGQGLF